MDKIGRNAGQAYHKYRAAAKQARYKNGKEVIDFFPIFLVQNDYFLNFPLKAW